MIYLKQVKLLDPDLVAGNPEELKYPYKAPAVHFPQAGYFPRGRERGGKIHPAGSDDE